MILANRPEKEIIIFSLPKFWLAATLNVSSVFFKQITKTQINEENIELIGKFKRTRILQLFKTG